MWRPIKKEDYMSRVPGLKPVESFSDPEGTSPYGRGFPWMETVWGNEEERILKVITSKIDLDQPKWDEHYFEHIANH